MMPLKNHLSQKLLAFFILFIITGVSLLSIHSRRPPEVRPIDAPTDEFSAERAMIYLEKIAEKPHAIGTEAHQEVLEYLVRTMKELGLNPFIQETTVTSDTRGVTVAAHVSNLVGMLKGTGSGKAVLLMAHYDSQPNARGAGD